MNLPMVIMGVSQLNKAMGGLSLDNVLKQLKAITSVRGQLRNGTISQAEAENILAAATASTGVAAKTAGQAFKLMLVSMGPLLAATALITAATVA